MRDREERRRDRGFRAHDAGDTLIEVLIALVVLSLCGLALITAFGTSISASADYRQLATVDTVLRTAEESAVAQIQQQANPLYIACGTDAKYTTEFIALPAVSATSPGYGNSDAVSSQLGAPVGFTVSFANPPANNNIQYWNNSTGAFGSCSSQTSPELITLTVTQSSSHVVDSGTFIVDDRGKPSTQGILSANPSAIGVGAVSVPITITGQGFNNNDGGANLGISVACAGVTVTSVTYNSTSSVSGVLSIANSATGEVNCAVTVTSGDGTTVTDYNVIYIDPAPTITAATPLASGTTNGVVTVTGTGFVLGSSLAASIGCSSVVVSQTQFVSATSLSLTVTIPGTVTPRTCDISVVNGDYGIGDGSQVFSITTDEAPTVVVTSPTTGDYTNQTTPTFVGTATAADLPTITVTIYSGPSAAGTPVQTLSTTQTSGNWSVAPSTGLPGNAQYTVVASQKNSGGTTGISAAVTFVVDTNAPIVTVASPYANVNLGTYYGNNASPTISGTGGTLMASTGQSADLSPVTVLIYLGGSVGGAPFETVGATTASGGTWAASSATLPAGHEYTAQATQQDGAGNVGKSNSVTFVVDTTSPVVSGVSVATSGGHHFTVTFNGGILAYSTTTSMDLPGVAYVCTSAQYAANSNSCYSTTSSKYTVAVTSTLSSGSTYKTPSTKVNAGTYYVTVVQSDGAGNLSAPVSIGSPVTI